MKHKTRSKSQTLMRAAAIAAAVVLLSPPAHANAALPLLFGSWLGIAVAIFPIIIVETLIFVDRLAMPLWHSAGVVLVANLASTLIGIPFAILVLSISAAFAKGAYGNDVDYEAPIAWRRFPSIIIDWLGCDAGLYLGPTHPRNQPLIEGTFVATVLIALALFFFLSWGCEYVVASWMLDTVPLRALDAAVRDGNILSYAGLAVFTIGSMLWLLLSAKRQRKKTAPHVVQSEAFPPRAPHLSDHDRQVQREMAEARLTGAEPQKELDEGLFATPHKGEKDDEEHRSVSRAA